MKRNKEMQKKFGQAVQFLPPRFRGKAMEMSADIKERAEEFRLRSGQKMTVLLPEGEIEIESESPVRHEELNGVLEIATGGSVHSEADNIKRGFITVAGGHRIGICGTAVVKNDEMTYIKDISSVSVRIAKEFKGSAQTLIDFLVEDGKFRSTLIISPPGYGKTTLLRDLIRLLSRDFRVAVADERGEIAAKYKGVPQFDVGSHTDVMEGVNKAKAMMLMLRAMSPQIIAVDEITASEDIKAISCAANCGVGLLATAHGDDLHSLCSRPLYKELLKQNVFEHAVVLQKNGAERSFKVDRISEINCGDDWTC